MRGDRPSRSLYVVDGCAAAPHARGSTPRLLGQPVGCDGCPACAGIDPRACSCRPPRRRLPRMRGDRPRDGRSARGRERAAPHARGSTPQRVVIVRVSYGCPACAGIDPKSGRARSWSHRLPRMRGDRPVCASVASVRAPAAPHARGSTRSLVACVATERGCPACAGIDPRASASCFCWSRLPRMRGDRPGEETSIIDAITAAPHARGSTPEPGAEFRSMSGCPACAGIDLNWDSAKMSVRRLPRMRGDRPRTRT